MTDENRIIVLEQRLDATIRRVDTKLDNITEVLQTLVRIEERQILTTQRLSELGASAAKHDERLRETELAVPENLGRRLNTIEALMPGLKEMRTWVIGGVLGCLGMMGVAVAHTVLKG